MKFIIGMMIQPKSGILRDPIRTNHHIYWNTIWLYYFSSHIPLNFYTAINLAGEIFWFQGIFLLRFLDFYQAWWRRYNFKLFCIDAQLCFPLGIFTRFYILTGMDTQYWIKFFQWEIWINE